MKSQDGYLTLKSGKWMGHYSRWVTDYGTGQRRRQQRAFVIGPASAMTKTKARNALRVRVAVELGITADSRVTLGWFAEHRWKPLRSGTWRDSTAQTNAELLKVITDRFGSTPIEDMDGVAMQEWLNTLAKTRNGSVVKHCRIFQARWVEIEGFGRNAYCDCFLSVRCVQRTGVDSSISRQSLPEGNRPRGRRPESESKWTALTATGQLSVRLFNHFRKL
jgi:hypothetical protein